MSSNFDFIAYKGKKKVPELQAIPNLEGAPLIETHAHLDMVADPSLAIARAAHVGITGIITIVHLGSRSEVAFEMIDVWREGAQMLLDEQYSKAKLPDTYMAVGVHPHEARHYTSNIEKHIIKLASDPRCVALGEAGLDYYYDHSPRETQRKVYARKLELAHELNLPAIIHLRDAHDDGLRILKEVGIPPAGAILHCFNREPEIAEPFLDLGCTLGFGGPVTFKNAHEVKAAAAAAPVGRIIVETDCPFMAPQPFRGQKCEPAHTLWVAAEIARLRGMTLPNFARETSAAAIKLFAKNT
ncbi:MAG: TatD family hydrolase [Coriobacteriia bacterium]|nr:TatD family hydrolase [Coriobacteriia bacterium]